MKKDEYYTLGIDFGTDSVRCLCVDVADGTEIAFGEAAYPRWANGLYCDAARDIFRQHPLDHIESLVLAVRTTLHQAGPAVTARIRALSVDTTGSTPAAVDASGMPLALTPSFHEDPDAMFILWKDHSAKEEAAAINAVAGRFAERFSVDYLRYAGGVYSAEWFWSKLLHVLRTNGNVRHACRSWVEHSDWMPFLLTGGTSVEAMPRNVCAAGHKALWSPDWNGLPSDDFFTALDPLLTGFAAGLYGDTRTADRPAGHLSQEWGQRLGLPPDVIVGIGALDAHMGAVGGQIKPYYLSKVMGTSTCDMLVAPADEMDGKYVPGICGLVPGSIVPGMTGMEAGQSAFGDIYAWFVNLLAWPLNHLMPEASVVAGRLLPLLTVHAERIDPLADSEWAVDWFNGRRTPDADPFVRGCIGGLRLGSDAPAIFRALVEASCFGSKAIIDRFIEQGIPVKGLIGTGGIARRSPFIQQMLADITGMSVRVSASEQTCALGAAMFAATAAGLYRKVEDAMQAMGHGYDRHYQPDPAKTAIYRQRYEQYQTTGRFITENTIHHE